MGLKVHSLAQLPNEPGSRAYYLYLLDYGWEEPLGRAIRDNFDRLADVASRHNAAVIAGLGGEFNDEVLSWHGINGAVTGTLLPAILITTRRPAHFTGSEATRSWNPQDDHLLLIPIRERCKTPTDVAELLDEIMQDVKRATPLLSFTVARRDKAGVKGALLDALVLQPSIAGVGVDLKALLRGLKGGRADGA